MIDEILAAYRKERTDDKGKEPSLRPEHREAAKLAATFSEKDLRLAASMAGAFARAKKKPGTGGAA